ncbi:MAG: cytochrome P450 [Actinomycetota bacterium]|nr:cytochrome P450 [Actinomycetota bacterium]
MSHVVGGPLQSVPEEPPFDPADRSFVADPYPVFAAMCRKAAVHWHPQLGQAVAVTHAACSAVLRHRSLGRVWADARPVERFTAFNLLHRNSLLESEPPTHGRLRGLVSAAFGRGHVQRLRPWVAQRAQTLVGQLAERIDAEGSADLLTTLAAPLPIEVIAELLGIPPADRPLLRPWSNRIVKMYEFDLDPSRQRDAEQAAADFVAYLRGLLAQRRKHNEPGNDLVSDLVAVTDTDGARLSEDELVATVVLLFMAGHEASVNVVGNGVLALMRHRDQWQRLINDPGLTAPAVEELIRYDSPVQLFERTATTDVTIAGFSVPAGHKIAVLLGAAGRDPDVFPQPDHLDVSRTPNPHLGFGAGIHYCLGAPLARIEAQATLLALCHRLPTLELAGQPQQRPEFVIRGLNHLPITAQLR